ncbi:MAG TPA: hypothetical protein VMK42_14890 [Anaeromyxobacteraceae bacterium]|nr:hypothetical protein [Anaeromyxobacteraceae bacterium]
MPPLSEHERQRSSATVRRWTGQRTVRRSVASPFPATTCRCRISEAAPFDAILLSCQAERIPPPLWEQLAEGGRLLYPKGAAALGQMLVLVTKTARGPRERRLAPVVFVPMRRQSG